MSNSGRKFNRRPLTVRFNQQEWDRLQDLIKFFAKPGQEPDPKDFIKFALTQIAAVKEEIKRKEAAAKAPQEQQCDTPDTSSPVSLEFSAGEPSPAA